MKTIMISGSRDPKGQTARAADAILDGVVKGGGSVERVFLPTLKLEHCRQCKLDGRGLCAEERRCVIEDDFAGLVEKIRHADAVVFANPVYWGSLSESMRSFGDRLRRICCRQPGRAATEGKLMIGVCVAGGGGLGERACCVDLAYVMRTCGFDIVDMFPVRRQNLEAKLKSLELAGEWLATEPGSDVTGS